MKNFILLFNTVKFLKPIQIYFRIFYFIRKRVQKVLNIKQPLHKVSNSQPILLNPTIFNPHTYNGKNQFIFLNISKNFESKIDWNYSEYGKLWTYNLNYFDFLDQEKITKDEGLKLIYDYIENFERAKDGLEPFPTSLRIINWIKFLNQYKIEDKHIDDVLYAQCYILLKNLEYHLLGNHLLENAFALLFGSYYFNDNQLYSKAKLILKKELNEQILDDGGHFELSPMYHQLMLFKTLESINLLKNNLDREFDKKRELHNFLLKKATLMLGWLKEISYENGDIPLLNDSANDIAPHSTELFKYAKELKIPEEKIALSSSGYRKIINKNYELITDVGEIGASYLAGHAHADTFNFELRIHGKPFIVDRGISTYQINQQRLLERSTLAHNCVVINQQNSSNVWSGFRVAERAEIIKLEEQDSKILATHNGYKKIGVLHTRVFNFDEKQIVIQDRLSKSINSKYYLHFHPSITKEEINKRLFIEDDKNFTIETYQYPLGYNKLTSALCIVIDFDRELTTRIKIENS